MKIDYIKNIQHNISLKYFNTYRVGGFAKYFLEVKDEQSLQEAVCIARENNIAYFILGGGTNLLVSNDGFNGLIIKILLQEREVRGLVLHAQSGVSMGILVQDAKKNALCNLEWAAGLPGTLGGAIYGNAGSCGGNIANIIETVRVYDPVKNIYYNCKKDLCGFAYRKSIFKKNKHIIISADIMLCQGNIKDITMAMSKNMQYRIACQPLAGQSEGCVFQNISIISLKKKDDAIMHNKDFINFKNKEFLPAGFVIDKAGLKGLCVGGAHVSKMHGNFIINDGGASAQDIITLIIQVKEKVFAHYGITLKEEIQII